VSKHCWRAILLIALMLAGNTLFAADTQDGFTLLLAQDRVRIKAWVEPDADIIVSQRVNLYIEVSTFRWFSGGTQIGSFDVEGAVVLRREKFAVNSTLQEGSDTWASQLWTIAIYPQRSGVISVPPIELTLNVAGEDKQSVTGTVSTSEITFSSSIPAAMQGRSQWIATSQFDVEETYDKASDNLNAGDSLLRTISFKAKNVAAMMLPAPEFQSQEGLAVYHKPVEIKDVVNRGDYLAQRNESISYLVERNGTYQLPALEFHWWNLQAQEMQTVVLPAKVISTSGETVVSHGGIDRLGEAESTGSASNMLKVIVGLLAIVCFLALAFFGQRILARRLRGRRQDYAGPTMQQLQGQFVNACHNADYAQAVSLLYQWLDHPQHEVKGRHPGESSVRVWLNRLGEDQLCDQFNQLMASACGEGGSAPAEFESLLIGLKSLAKNSGSLFGLGEAVDLRLN
jgi:hypothetical protein